ncbi:hypothetical protein GKE82_24475 [Conexibacter sp. W3-3-2]|uniref:hypothetical protein n=1 Tax=Conexibacter sp. W3-3-2 TaxID=2675227 RepID=UPI0012B806EC|nr:hypothetical protein [Conexibacter sp. W3-3-2]MTD47366.1 hypothetical protein [Conexibacter sp. W3-3-2]
MWLLQADDPTAAQGLLSTREVYERIPESAHRLITDAILDTLDLTWQEAMDDAAPLLAGEGSAAARMAVLAQTAEACSGMRAELDDLRHAGVVKDSRFKGDEFVSDQYDGPARAASAVVQITCRPCAGAGPAAVRRALQPLRSKPVTVVVAPSTPHSGSITVTMHIAAAPLSAAQRLTVQLRELLDRSDQIATVGAPTLTHPYA